MPRTPRRIERTTAFRRDFKRESKGQHRRDLDEALRTILELLVADEHLPAAKRDHQLSGQWADCRECHLRPDLLLIYRKRDDETLELVRLGSHGELFG